MEEKLKQFEQSYHEIPIPEELNTRVKQAIENGKIQRKAQRKDAGKKKAAWKKVLQRTMIGMAACMAVIVLMANSGAKVCHAMEEVPVLGAITRVVTFRTYEDTTKDMSAKVKTPKVEGSDKDLNRQLKAYTDEIIEQYKQDVKNTGGEGKEALNLSYKTVTDNQRVFALRFDKTVSMADTNEEVRIYNVDKKTGKIITLKDLFKDNVDYITVISNEIKTQMRTEMKENADNQYFLDDDMPGLDFDKITADSTFYINKDGQLTLVFNKGDVAPMYMGICEFTIPTDSLKDMVRSGYVK